MNIKSLDKAIKEFNENKRPARIYFDKKDNSFHTSVYFNDIEMSNTFSVENFVSIFSKIEEQAHLKLDEHGKSYIIEYANLVLDGMETYQIDYELAEKTYHLS